MLINNKKDKSKTFFSYDKFLAWWDILCEIPDTRDIWSYEYIDMIITSS